MIILNIFKLSNFCIYFLYVILFYCILKLNKIKMATKDNNKDEELLILSDDSESDFKIDEDIIIDDDDTNISDSLISFDDEKSDLPKEDNENNLSDDFSLSFDDSKDSESSEIILEDSDSSDDLVENSEENDSDNISFDLDSDSQNDENLDSEKNFKSEESEWLWVNLDDWLIDEEINIQDNDDFNNNSWIEVWTMTDILSEAISKAEKRQWLIESDIEKRETHISKLKNEIKELESKVWAENEEVTNLNTEKQSILKNIKSLEKMKTDMNLTNEIKK